MTLPQVSSPDANSRHYSLHLYGDWVVRDAANYNLTVIGEALNSLSEDFVARHRDLPVRQAKSFRNKLAHEYFAADHDIFWDTITRDVPALAAKIAAIRGSAGQ